MILEYNKKRHESLTAHFENMQTLLDDAINELKKLNVNTVINYETLSKGEFVAIFHAHHKKEHQTNYKAFVYEKYLEACGLDTAKLQDLESEYMIYLNKQYSYYKLNNSYYSYAHNNKHLTEYKEALSNAPEKHLFSVWDFVEIKRNSITVNIPKSIFTLETTNKKQIELINDINEFVEIAKKLGLERLKTKELISNYVNYIDTDFKIDFNYNRVLTHK